VDAPTINPEFEWEHAGLIAAAALEVLRADVDLVAWATGGIDDYELEQLLTVGERDPPLIGVWVEASGEERQGSNRQAKALVDVGIGIMTAVESTRGSKQWLRARVCGRIHKDLAADRGILRDPDGNELTLALLGFVRIPRPRLLAGNKLAVTLCNVRFETWLYEGTREVLL
jgi:hypothetical protein